MKHAGMCFRNTKFGPAVSEEYAAIEAGRRLMYDDDGKYRGDDSAVFLDLVVADNDVRAPNNLIKEQHDIIGKAADGVAEHIPDIGHVIKDCNNELYTDLWKSMLLLSFCRAGNIERTHQEMSAILNLDVLEPERKHMERWNRKRKRDGERNNSEGGKKKRHESKAVKDKVMMKEDSKKRHRSAKVSVKESAAVGRKKRSVTCASCKQSGHNRAACPLPMMNQQPRDVDLLDWHQDTLDNSHKLTGKRYKPDLIDWG